MVDGTWKLTYTVQSGPDLGVPYSVTGYPTGNNPATSFPWDPATDGWSYLIVHHATTAIIAIIAIIEVAPRSGVGVHLLGRCVGDEPTRLTAEVPDLPLTDAARAN